MPRPSARGTEKAAHPSDAEKSAEGQTPVLSAGGTATRGGEHSMRRGTSVTAHVILTAGCLGEGCYFLVSVQLFEKCGTLIGRYTALIEKVSASIVLWVLCLAWSVGAAASWPAFTDFLRQQAGKLDWPATTTKPSLLTELISLLDLSSVSCLILGYLLAVNVDHILRRVLVAGLLAADRAGLHVVADLLKVLLLLFPKPASRRFHDDEKVGAQTYI
eukprot:SAG31_NODE_1621_length_7724_cov_3.297049_5_plen_217_part_00